MHTKTSNTTEELTNKLFICRYSTLFNEQLAKLDNVSKHLIRNNKQLNELYDLFLDFIIDSNQHLEYNEMKKQEREQSNVGSY